MRTFTLNENEEMIAIFRKHPFFIWIAAVKYIVLAIIPIFALSFINNVINFQGYGTVLYFTFLTKVVYLSMEWIDLIHADHQQLNK